MACCPQILLGLFGATSSHRHKWGWFGLSCLFLVFVNVGLLFTGEPAAQGCSSRATACLRACSLACRL